MSFYTCCHVGGTQLLHRRCVINIHMLENFCVQNACSANNFGIRNVRFPAFYSVFVRINYTSNMAACYNSYNAYHVTTPHIFSKYEHEILSTLKCYNKFAQVRLYVGKHCRPTGSRCCHSKSTLRWWPTSATFADVTQDSVPSSGSLKRAETSGSFDSCMSCTTHSWIGSLFLSNQPLMLYCTCNSAQHCEPWFRLLFSAKNYAAFVRNTGTSRTLGKNYFDRMTENDVSNIRNHTINLFDWHALYMKIH